MAIMEGMHPIAEENPVGASAQVEEFLDSSVISPMSGTLTESTESNHTVRGSEMPQSPGILLHTTSFPFPSLGVESETPIATPGSHMPFTALSPTVQPPGMTPMKVAKGKIAREFMASGKMSPSVTRPVFPQTISSLEGGVDGKPNLYEIAIRLQMEPGLAGWWKQVTQILRELFHAERATLAVPSDRTEIENVPWAQLAEYTNVDDDDNLSRATVDANSTRSSISEFFSHESPVGDRFQDKESKPIRRSPFPSPALHARPKLEFRHSYAGKTPLTPTDLKPNVSFKRPRPTRTASQASLIDIRSDLKAPLSTEQLKLYEGEQVSKGTLSEDTSASTRLSAGRILEVMQPLEADIEPLITSAGVVRVLNNSTATVLTRKYVDPGEENKTSQVSAANTSKKIIPRGHSNQGDKLSSDAKASKKVKRPRSSTGSVSKSSITSESNNQSFGGSFTYEDFVQIPGTPWAQSPAPSPAALPDTDENPFFADVSIVQDSFKKHAPSHHFSSGQQFEAIGLDRSSSILQIPLIHPSAHLSQPQRLHRFREESYKDRRGDKLTKIPTGRTPSAERKRKIPLAILSILAPVVPYPSDLVEILNALSPLLATSLYAARQHSNLQTEVNGLTLERSRAAGRLPLRVEKPSHLSDLPSVRGLSYIDVVREDSFSPFSTSSAASSSGYATTALNSPQGSENPNNEKLRSSTEAYTSESDREQHAASSAQKAGSSEDYFSDTQQEARSEQTQSSKVSSNTKPSPMSRQPTQKRSHFLHSQGATFHNTHPSLPTATTLSQAGDDPSDTDGQESHMFKEPSLSLLRSMIDIGATQQFIAEPESGKLLWVNSKFQAYRSGSSQKLDDQLWNNIYYKDRKAFKREWSRALETGEQLSQQVRLERFDGHFRWFHIKFLPLKDKLGVIKYWSGQAMDIHDLHEAEVKAAKSKEKAASEAKYRAIANSLPVIVFAASVPTGMTFANTQWLSYSGQSLEEALGFGFLEHVHPDDLTKCRFPGIGEQSLEPPRPTTLKRNSFTRTDSATSSAGDSDATSATETTVKARSEKVMPPSPVTELQIPNDLLRALARDGVILCAKDGQGNLSITTEMRLKSKDNEYRWHLVQGSYIESVDFGQGEAQWFIACTDISAQKRNEAKIQEANSALEHVNNALEQEMQQKMGYLSSMSHEIRTPLNGIIGNLQFLINSGLEESAGEWAHGAQEAAKGMHDLINDILDLSKAEAKMLKLSSHWFSPRGLMEQVMDMLNPKASEKKIELCHETDSNVPNSLRGDSGRIRQVLLNLAGNAIKFTNQGEVIIRCDLLDHVSPSLHLPQLKDNEIFIRWTVVDTGIGFSAEEKKLLFKAYSQIKSKNTRDTGGTGLGLILCKTMVNLHGGDIDASSQPDTGSTFTFFARFRVRRDAHSQNSSVSAIPSPGFSGPLLHEVRSNSPSRSVYSPASLQPSIASQDSPGLLSDSSSAQSLRSSIYQRSLYSSASTAESPGTDFPLKLTLPNQLSSGGITKESGVISPLGSPKSLPTNRVSTVSSPYKTGPLSPKAATTSARTQTPANLSERSVSISGSLPSKHEIKPDPDRANFRPPMLSILVICPPESTRRITCDRIQFVAPRTTPCNITSEGSVDAGLDLLLGEEPILFTHIILRLTSDPDTILCLEKIITSPRHLQACIVIITDQSQISAIKKGLPDFDFESLNHTDRVKMVLKPAHPHKLAKIFDPFNENTTLAEDPKEAKREEEKRLQREAYALFKRILGGKGIRVIAVEDNRLQMNVCFKSEIV
jgi:signal transduction histidine kinase/PAS domain-containing protein